MAVSGFVFNAVMPGQIVLVGGTAAPLERFDLKNIDAKMCDKSGIDVVLHLNWLLRACRPASLRDRHPDGADPPARGDLSYP
jgi:hypothetical protein